MPRPATEGCAKRSSMDGASGRSCKAGAEQGEAGKTDETKNGKNRSLVGTETLGAGKYTKRGPRRINVIVIR